MAAANRAGRLAELLQECQKELASLAEENAWMRRELGLAEDVELPMHNAPTGASPASPLRASILASNLSMGGSGSGCELGVAMTRVGSDSVPAEKIERKETEFEVMELWKNDSNKLLRRTMTGDNPHTISHMLTEGKRRPPHKRATLHRSSEPRLSLRDLQMRYRNCVPRFPLGPNHHIKLVWDLLGLSLICWDLFYIPFQALEPEDTFYLQLMSWTTLSFWTLDMIMSNLCGFYRQGDLIMSQKQITINYLKTWFVIDFIIVAPDWFTSVTENDDSLSGNLKIFRAARALRVLRLLRLLKLQRLVNIVYDFIDSEYSFIMVTMLRLVVFIVVLNHVIACVWFWIGKLTHEGGMKSWLTDTPNGDMLGLTLWYKYTTALHWSLTQFTPASMEVSARNVFERVVSIIVLFFALITFSSIVGSITTSMTALRSMQGDTKKQFWMLRRYLSSKKVPYETKARIIKFLEYQTSSKQGEVSLESIGILKLLSGPLQNLLAYELNKQHIEEHPFFRHLEENMKPVMIKLCYTVLTFTAFAPEDVVFRTGEEAIAMYFVVSGDPDYTIPLATMPLATEDENKSTELVHGCWLAEAALWTSWWHRGQLVCNHAAELGTIKPGPFASIVKVHGYPWRFCRRYAELFVSHLNLMPPGSLNDVLDDYEWLQDTVEAAEDIELDGLDHSALSIERTRSSTPLSGSERVQRWRASQESVSSEKSSAKALQLERGSVVSTISSLTTECRSTLQSVNIEVGPDSPDSSGARDRKSKPGRVNFEVDATQAQHRLSSSGSTAL